MNFTVANHSSLKITSGYEHYDSVEFSDIPEMATSGFNYCACKLKDGVRLDDNFDGCVDVLILDIDAGCTIEQAKIIFAEFEYFIITSKSHQKEKNDIVCDRFRLFLKLERTVHIRQEVEGIYRTAIMKYPFIDSACRNVSRLYYSSPEDADIIYNSGNKYPVKIILSYVEDTKTEKTTIGIGDDYFCFNELTERWENKYGEILESEGDNDEAKLRGAVTVLDNEFYKGNRNHALFKVACMLLKDGLSKDDVANFIIKENDSRDGMSLKEVMSCFKSAERTIR